MSSTEAHVLTYGTFYRLDPGPEGTAQLTQWRGFEPKIKYPGVIWVADGEEE